MNQELLEASTLYNYNDFFNYLANKDSIYAYFKQYSTPFSYETFKTYKLNVGEEYTIPISDEHGLVWKERFFYRYKG